MPTARVLRVEVKGKGARKWVRPAPEGWPMAKKRRAVGNSDQVDSVLCAQPTSQLLIFLIDNCRHILIIFSQGTGWAKLLKSPRQASGGERKSPHPARDGIKLGLQLLPRRGEEFVHRIFIIDSLAIRRLKRHADGPCRGIGFVLNHPGHPPVAFIE